MRWQRTIAVLVLMAVGCGHQGPKQPEERDPLATLPDSRPSADGGQQQGTPEQLAQRLESSEATTRARAARSLAKLGETGYPYLLNGLKNPSDDVRLSCLTAIGSAQLIGHGQETLPLVAGMLASPLPALRQIAAGRLSWYGSEALPDLRRVAKTDEDPEVRQTAANSIGHIEARTGARETVPPAK